MELRGEILKRLSKAKLATFVGVLSTFGFSCSHSTSDANLPLLRSSLAENPSSNVKPIAPTLIPEERTDASTCEDLVVTSEKDACAENAYDESDKNLTAVYQAMQRKIRDQLEKDTSQLKTDPENPVLNRIVSQDRGIQSRIFSAQRAWSDYRDANCLLVSAQNIGGSGEGTLDLSCLNAMTLSRTTELKKISEDLFSKP